MRLTAFQSVGGFDATLIAGEEPELCHRLRRNDWRIYRLDADMTVHDADMKRFSQWWRRCARTGYVSAEGAHRLGREKEHYAVRPFLSTWFWGLLLPITAFGAAWPTRGLSLMLLVGYFILASRIHRGIRHKGASAADSALYAFFCVLSKFPAMEGQIRYISRVVRRQQGSLIEYK